jgi:hypothetical protein
VISAPDGAPRYAEASIGLVIDSALSDPFLAAGLALETFEEPLGADRLYPYIVALRVRK